MALLPSAAMVVIMVTVYYALPLDQQLGFETGIKFTVGLLALTAAVAWQVRAVLHSSTPRLRAIEAIAVGLPGLLLLHAAVYILIVNSAPSSFTEPLSRTDALYFTVTVFSTVGFGHTAPRSELARIVVTTQMLIGLVAVGIVAKVVLGAVQVAVPAAGGLGPRRALCGRSRFRPRFPGTTCPGTLRERPGRLATRQTADTPDPLTRAGRC
jgi:hypothetical protein